MLSSVRITITYNLYKERFSKIMSVSQLYTFTIATVVLRIAGYIDLLCLPQSVHRN